MPPKWWLVCTDIGCQRVNEYPNSGDHHPVGSEVLAEIRDQRLAAQTGDVLLRADLGQAQGVITECSLQTIQTLHH